jgi:hypothetical protein
MRSIEARHFAVSVAAGLNADTSNFRTALSQKYKLIAKHASAAVVQRIANRFDRAMAAARSSGVILSAPSPKTVLITNLQTVLASGGWAQPAAVTRHLA